MAKHDFRVIHSYPCPKLIAPFIYITVTDAHASVDSIYRGDDARGLLNKYGHHSQFQLYHANGAQRAAWGILGEPDSPGTSTHELKSDGRAYPTTPAGHDLPWWCQGFDVNGAEQADACIRAAAKHGWLLFRPYPTGAELHHLNFKHEPHPNGADKARVIKLRTVTLPRS